MLYQQRRHWYQPCISFCIPCERPSARRGRSRLLHRGLLYCAFLTFVMSGMVASGRAAWVRPLEGVGNFHSRIDVCNRWRADDLVDVVLLFSVANRELTFIRRDGRLQGELQVTAELQGTDGTTVSRTRQVHLLTTGSVAASSGTLYQVFSLLLPGVSAHSGQVVCRLMDENRRRGGLLNLIKRRQALSEAEGDWEAVPRQRDPEGLYLGDPIFLSGAPVDFWREEAPLARELERTILWEHLHPNRRYGLEQDRLQVYFEIEAPLAGGARQACAAGLYLQVLARDLDFALRDTIRFDALRLGQLAGGHRTGLCYELDINQLPAGCYLLSCGPANARGHGWLAEFDVIWNLETLYRPQDELLGEGRTVLLGPARAEFLAAGQAARGILLEEFWAAHDPDLETEINEGYLEFRRRVSYVRRKYGGFGASGAVDPRGRIYVLLGPPEDIQSEAMPLNATDLEDAFVKVFDRYAPDRPGTVIKGGRSQGTDGHRPGGEGWIPMPHTHQSRREIAARRRNIGRMQSFELWKYNHAGHSLFPNQFSQQSLGLRFLFVDRTGTGSYVLESSNAWELGN